VLAGLNAPGHHTVSGRAELVRRIAARALTLGAEVSPVQAAGPWHSPLVAGAADRIRQALTGLRLSRPRLPLYLASKGGAESEPEQLREWLARQVCEPVRWYPVVTQLLPLADHFLEVGPGHVLIGLVRRVIGGAGHHTLRAIERSGGRLSLAPSRPRADVMSTEPGAPSQRSG
jgi:[acyl-carrier-protein] S-malonyltransferase